MKDYSLRDEKSRLIQASATSLHEHITELFDNGYDQGYADATIDLAHEESNRAYQQGYEDGRNNTEYMVSSAHKHGMEESWECARTIINKYGNDFGETRKDIFGYGGYKDVINNLTASEAISKIKEYEEQQKQDAIQVGDEVNHQGLKSVVVRIAYDCIYTISECGTTPKYDKDDNLAKTGRTFPQIAEVLEKMRGEE